MSLDNEWIAGLQGDTVVRIWDFQKIIEQELITPTNIPTSSPASIPTNTPTIQPTQTPTNPPPTLTPSPTPSIALNTVIVTDDITSSDDLSGGIDEDGESERCLVIRWNLAYEDIRDTHVYVSIDGGQYNYLGRTGNPSERHLEWKEGTTATLKQQYLDGPEYGHCYSFAVYVITQSGVPHHYGPVQTKGEVQYVAERESIPTPVPITPHTVIVTDDTLTFEDISGQTDYDEENNRSLVVRWNYPESDIRDYHVYVSENSGAWQYLGRPLNRSNNYLNWTQNQQRIAPLFEDGPQFENDYLFSVFAIREDHGPGNMSVYGPINNAGNVRCVNEVFE